MNHISSLLEVYYEMLDDSQRKRLSIYYRTFAYMHDNVIPGTYPVQLFGISPPHHYRDTRYVGTAVYPADLFMLQIPYSIHNEIHDDSSQKIVAKKYKVDFEEIIRSLHWEYMQLEVALNILSEVCPCLREIRSRNSTESGNITIEDNANGDGIPF